MPHTLLGHFDPDLLPRFKKIMKKICPVFSTLCSLSCPHAKEDLHEIRA